MRREDSKAFIYNFLHSKNSSSSSSLYKGSTGVKVGSMGQKGESMISTVGCKVLPICDASAATAGSEDGDHSCRNSFEKDGRNSCERRAVSRLKELLRWAAAAKANKKGIKGWKDVLYLRNRVTLREPLNDVSSNSSRINFKWDVGSCSASSSVYSPMSLVTKNLPNPAQYIPRSEDRISSAHWITTDANFVVLEL